MWKPSLLKISLLLLSSTASAVFADATQPFLLCVIDKDELMRQSKSTLEIRAEHRTLIEQARLAYEREILLLEKDTRKFIDAKNASPSPEDEAQARNLAQRLNMLQENQRKFVRESKEWDSVLKQKIIRASISRIHAVAQKTGCSAVIPLKDTLYINGQTIDITNRVLAAIQSAP